MIVAESLARLAGTDPAILQPRQAALVETDAPDGQLPRMEHARVSANEPQEDRGRREQEPETGGKSPHQNGKEYAGKERRKPRVREPRVGGCQPVTGGAASIQ